MVRQFRQEAFITHYGSNYDLKQYVSTTQYILNMIATHALRSQAELDWLRHTGIAVYNGGCSVHNDCSLR